MARSESQGLQIAVIVSTMLTVVLGIVTYLYYAAYEKEVDAKKAADGQKAAAEKASADKEYRVKALEFVLGNETVTRDAVNGLKAAGGADVFADEMLAAYDKQVGLFENAGVDGQKGIKDLANYVSAATISRSTANATLNTQAIDSNTSALATETREKGRADAAEKARDTATKDLEGEKTKFAGERTDFVKKLADMEAQLKAKDAAAKKQKEDDDKKLLQLSNKITLLEGNLVSANKEVIRLRDSGPDFEGPDGEITWVNQKERVAWINVGYADGLQRQTTFSVYDHDENGVASTGKSKARIEVVRVLEPHLAECRILEDEIKNPLLPGDKIFTPAWTPGMKVHFALNGFLDIDGDGRSDNAEIRNIVAMNGGVVDAEVREDGSRVGSINHHTRYLVRGKAPTERDVVGEGGKKALASYSQMLTDAEGHGTEVIDLTRFLGQMGWKAQERTMTIGPKRSGDQKGAFRPRNPAGGEEKVEKPAAAEEEETTPLAPAKPAKPAAEPAMPEDDPFK